MASEDYERAMRTKLRRELDVPVASVRPELAPASPDEPYLH